MVKAIRVHAPGGPDVLRFEDVEIPPPGSGEVRVRHRAIGLNYIDVYFRNGSYPSPTGLPFTLGNEGAGDVLAVGEGVTEFRPGDRVAYVAALGSYAEERNVPAAMLVKLPDAISYETAAAMMLKGLTSEYLLFRSYPVTKGTRLLMHAAAGGVGLILTQWANHLGAKVIGTVGSEEKAELARAHGCHHTILYRQEDFVARTREITGGAGVDVVYDGVGRTTFPASLDVIRPLGTFVTFGSSSGAIDAFNIGLLGQKGSLFATRPTLFTFLARRDWLVEMAGRLMDVVERGVVDVRIDARFPLADAAAAHRALEARETTGSTILIP